MLMEKLASEKLELEALENSLHHAYACFDQSSDPDILEACIHEISALSARRSAAWRNIRSMDGDIIKWQSR